MYKEKLTLTNKRRTPYSLSNHFDDTFGLIDKIVECNNAEEFCNVARRYSRYGCCWKIDKDDNKQTRLIWKDTLGNVFYLIAYKETKSRLAGFTSAELVEELQRRGFKVF